MRERWITVVGQGRGGTSPLYYAIVDGLKRDGHRPLGTYERYEPTMFAGFERHARGRWVVAKFLTNNPGWNVELAEPFSHRIQITRDPRDMAVSAMLFSAVHIARRRQREKRMGRWNELLAQKERDPRSIGLRELYEVALTAYGKKPEKVWRTRWQDPIQIFETIRPMHLRLEDLTHGNAARTASDYLGIELALAPPPAGKEHVLRSGESSWRRWFTPGDIDYFRPLMHGFMQRFGYADDWELDPQPTIEPAESSQYVAGAYRRIVERESDLRDEEKALAVRRFRADHGRPKDSLYVARQLMRKGVDLEEARERALFAASAGLRRGAMLAARMFGEGIGGPVNVEEAAYWRAQSERALFPEDDEHEEQEDEESDEA